MPLCSHAPSHNDHTSGAPERLIERKSCESVTVTVSECAADGDVPARLVFHITNELPHGIDLNLHLVNADDCTVWPNFTCAQNGCILVHVSTCN
jgi:hypothetical protein